MIRWRRLPFVLLVIAAMAGCASLPPGSGFTKTPSQTYAHPEETRLGHRFDITGQDHGGNSAFRIIPVGADGFLIRMQMINAAEQSIDLQYFVFHSDDTGHLLTGAVLRAADRGVRVRILIDDGETYSGDEQLTLLEAHPKIEIRIFNPFAYRGHLALFRAAEFALNSSRLDYRMHNKLLVVDDAVALLGGRNIGDQYFQIDPASQFADDDIFATGPIVPQLSASFDEFWNSRLAIPSAALSGGASSQALDEYREKLGRQDPESKPHETDYAGRVAAGEPFEGIAGGRLPLIWAHASLISDSPDKKSVEDGSLVGRLIHRAVAEAASATRTELLMITPYFIPGAEGMKLFDTLRRRDVRIRILTNSLESSTVLAAQVGYMHYRLPLLASGVELNEIRSHLGNDKGSGQSPGMSRHGNFSLHAKLFVFDRERLFIGSMNFDQRSMHLNTEIGLLIDSPELARQLAARFDAMVQPVNPYRLTLRPGTNGTVPALEWTSQEGSASTRYEREPARSEWQRFNAELLNVLPLDDEL
jgi:putative cardiolipin synthase